ncbi:TPR repeat region-containing protein [Rhodococcus sp. OK302]|uniref:TPR repeat region-containing protein n=1 Tax=Rhodococcus sp. OK302 TaxID=1882769 RepID=UPI003F8DDAE4
MIAEVRISSASRLECGDTAAIPASQMEYLNQLSRSLDGKTPQQIEDLLSKLPPDARAFTHLVRPRGGTDESRHTARLDGSGDSLQQSIIGKKPSAVPQRCSRC